MKSSKRSAPIFAFLVHPRSVADIRKTFPALSFLPYIILERGLECIGPVSLGCIQGLPYKSGQGTADGIVVSVSMTAHRMLTHRKKAFRKLKKIIARVKKSGVRYVGLGSLTSPIADGGAALIGYPDIFFTNGNALTAVMTLRGIITAADMKGIDLKQAKVAVLGATGSIGWVVSESLVSWVGVTDIILVGRTPENLSCLKDTILSHVPGTQISCSTEITSILSADVVVVATSGSGTLITPAHLKRNALVYDITQPQNVDVSVRNLRSDVMVVDGALVRLPNNMLGSRVFGLPQGSVFACFAETMVVAALDQSRDFSIGRVTRANMEIIGKQADAFGLTLAPLSGWGTPLQ